MISFNFNIEKIKIFFLMRKIFLKFHRYKELFYECLILIVKRLELTLNYIGFDEKKYEHFLGIAINT